MTVKNLSTCDLPSTLITQLEQLGIRLGISSYTLQISVASNKIGHNCHIGIEGLSLQSNSLEFRYWNGKSGVRGYISLDPANPALLMTIAEDFYSHGIIEQSPNQPLPKLLEMSQPASTPAAQVPEPATPLPDTGNKEEGSVRGHISTFNFWKDRKRRESLRDLLGQKGGDPVDVSAGDLRDAVRLVAEEVGLDYSKLPDRAKRHLLAQLSFIAMVKKEPKARSDGKLYYRVFGSLETEENLRRKKREGRRGETKKSTKNNKKEEISGQDSSSYSNFWGNPDRCSALRERLGQQGEESVVVPAQVLREAVYSLAEQNGVNLSSLSLHQQRNLLSQLTQAGITRSETVRSNVTTRYRIYGPQAAEEYVRQKKRGKGGGSDESPKPQESGLNPDSLTCQLPDINTQERSILQLTRRYNELVAQAVEKKSESEAVQEESKRVIARLEVINGEISALQQELETHEMQMIAQLIASLPND